MTMTSANRAAPASPHRSIRIYERLLVLYPKSFRQEYGADMVQTFGDLLMTSGASGRLWRRIFGDVATSATRQRLMQLGGAGGGGRPWAVLLAFLAIAAAFFLNLGSGAYVILLPALAVVFVLPALGFGLLWYAGHVWRTTGTRTVGRALVGLACFGPVVWAVTMSPDDWGYWVGVGIVLLLIVGLGGGALWGLIILVTSRQTPAPTRRRGTAVGLIVAAVVVLGGMAGMGFNSYLDSRPPPGDHSPGNASAESRALWDAAHTGDLEVVVNAIEACADPFVHFDDGGRARSNAEWWAGVNHSGREPVAEPMLGTYLEIIDALEVAEETWSERCNP